MSESLKTIVAVVVAVLMVGAAYVYRPKVAEIQNQDLVGTLLFEGYDSQYVKRVEVKSFSNKPYQPASEGLEYQELDLKQTDDRWVMANHHDFVAGNKPMVSKMTGFLNQIKILEVVAESASESELQQYGLLEPSAQSSPDYSGAKIRLTVSHPENKTLELLVGRNAKSSGGRQNTFYVKKQDDPRVYRVEVERNLISARLADYVDLNVMRLTVNLKQVTYERYLNSEVQSSDRLKGGLPAYRVFADFANRKQPLQSLKVRDQQSKKKQWVNVPTRPAPVNFEKGVVNRWFNGGLVPQTTQLAITAIEPKEESVQSLFVQGKIQELESLGPLKDLGFRFRDDSEVKQIEGSGGTIRIGTLSGLVMHLVVGDDQEDGTVPAFIYATVDKNLIPKLPAEPKYPEGTDSATRNKREELKKKYKDLVQKRDQFILQMDAKLEATNERLGPWVFFVAKKHLNFQTAPFDFSSYLKKPTPPKKAEKVEAKANEEKEVKTNSKEEKKESKKEGEAKQ